MLDAVFCADISAMELATVKHIVDGDTLDVELAGATVRVRIFGIDTPERGQPCFSEAAAFLQRAAGSRIRMRPDVRNRDPYDRLLRYVYTPDGLSIDAASITAGYAHAWQKDGALKDDLVALEDRARLNHVGCLWGP